MHATLIKYFCNMHSRALKKIGEGETKNKPQDGKQGQ